MLVDEKRYKLLTTLQTITEVREEALAELGPEPPMKRFFARARWRAKAAATRSYYNQLIAEAYNEARP